MEKAWRIIDLLNWTSDYLADKKFDNPRLNAELLLGHTLGLRRIDLYLQYDRPLLSQELEEFKKVLKKRLKHIPIQYITGKTEFMSLAFRVNPGVYIPRPETETLVEAALERLKKREGTLKIADIGTGCGNISISLARELENALLYAVDISFEALKVARDNAVLHQVEKRMRFIQGDLLTPFGALSGKLDAVLSNPPYVRHDELNSLPKEVKDYEPTVALDGGPEGVKFHRLITLQAARLLKGGGLLALEVGDGQAERVYDIIQGAHTFQNIKKIRDLAGTERVVLAERG